MALVWRLRRVVFGIPRIRVIVNMARGMLPPAPHSRILGNLFENGLVLHADVDLLTLVHYHFPLTKKHSIVVEHSTEVVLAPKCLALRSLREDKHNYIINFPTETPSTCFPQISALQQKLFTHPWCLRACSAFD